MAAYQLKTKNKNALLAKKTGAGCSKEEMVIWMSMMESRRDDDAIQRRRTIACKRLFCNYEGS